MVQPLDREHVLPGAQEPGVERESPCNARLRGRGDAREGIEGDGGEVRLDPEPLYLHAVQVRHEAIIDPDGEDETSRCGRIGHLERVTDVEG
jgi:hypothetical protein